MQGAEDKAVKAFIEASHNRLYNPYHFANLVKIAGAIPGSALHRTAIGWFMLSEIDYSYGVGDPVVGQLASRIVHEVLSDYEELPDYNPSRGFESGSASVGGTWEDYESRYTPSFIRRGFDA
jgi:hypothetical protein